MNFAGVMPPQQQQPPLGSPAHPQQQQQQQPFFGLIIPGRPVRTDFAPVDASGLKFSLTLSCPGDMPHPLARITQLVLFWTQSTPFPASQGVLCYWQIAAAASQMAPTASSFGMSTNSGMTPGAATGFQLLGAITADCPSSVLQTGWSEHEELMGISKPGAPPVNVTIALSVEPLSNLQNILQTNGAAVVGSDGAGAIMASATPQAGRRLFVAQKIALDLFRFMQSFDTGSGGPGQMVVPNNIFDRWFKRFENRFQRDPNFFLKNNEADA